MSTSPISAAQPNSSGQNSSARIIFASFIGTAIEFYDFYVYATAAALVIGPVFFPHGSATAQALSAFVTFGIAFVARPIGSFLFGHFGDRIGRKSTLVASLLVMGLSTTLIGFVPGYDCRSCCASCASARGSAWAANGAAPRCSPPKTRRPASAAGSACSRNSGRRSAFSRPMVCSSRWPCR
jgi:MFS family permease